MTLNSEIIRFKAAPSPLLWDATWIDPALRRMAETAAARSGLTVEVWLERAIRKTCCASLAYDIADEATPKARSATGVLTRANRDAAREPVHPSMTAAERRAAAAARARQHSASQGGLPDAAGGAIVTRPRQLPRRFIPKQPWRSIPLYAAATMAVVLVLIAVIAASQPSLRLGARDPDTRPNSPLPTRHGANLGAAPGTTNALAAMITRAVETYLHHTAIDRTPAWIMVAAEPPVSVLGGSPERNHQQVKNDSTQVAMAQIPTPPALTIARVTLGGSGAEALLVAELNARANTGDPIAKDRLGILYAVGKGVIRDYSHAVFLLRASAASWFAEAQYDYGIMCDRGLGVARDPAESARWYATAAWQGHAPAALGLGYAYAEGLGVARNLPQGARWFRRVAKAGQVNAQLDLADMLERGAGVARSRD
jgi:hypothetical protein